MKANIGKYTNYFGPYQLAELLCFWAKDVEDEYGMKSKPEWVHHFGEWLAHGSVLPETEVGETTKLFEDRPTTWLCNLLTWINLKKKRKIEVHIDNFDTWNMDNTLGYIIRPMLKQIKERKQGAPMVDIEDVPESLRPSEEEVEKYKKEGETDDKFFARWEWILDEMIFAFESLDGGENRGWELQFTQGDYDFHFKKLKDGSSELIRGPNDTAKTDFEARKAYEERIQNGFRLFGKYYTALWT